MIPLFAAPVPSPMQLILDADPVVKLVMLVLVAFSLVSWAIIGERLLLLRRSASQTEAFLQRFWATASLEEAHGQARHYSDSAVAAAFVAGYKELVRLGESGTEAQENVARALRRAASAQIGKLEKGIPFLASCGSAAPFIGLFGTVWGILRAFQQIGATGTTSIAEVGPFISEALIATAVGLFAAIPAVLFYNGFAVALKKQTMEVNHFTADFLNLVERHRGRGR